MKYEWLEGCFLQKKGVVKDFKEEWQWHRYKIRDKLFAAICGDQAGRPVISLKADPADSLFLRERYPDIAPGHYMDKKHWVSVQLEGNVPEEVLRKMVDQSYDLVLKNFSKKAQKEILEET